MIDPSTLLAVLLAEPEAEELALRMADAPVLLLSAATQLEATAVAEGSRLGAAREAVESLCHALNRQAIPLDRNHLLWALQGWREFGKGRHQAGLNLGDCFSDGLARAMTMPLLHKGNDFGLTDVLPVDPRR